MTIEILWNTQSIDQWERNFNSVPHSNILQSYRYAKVFAPLHRQKPRWGLIRINGADAGIVQMFEAGILWNAVHALMIDRGPLWFEGFGTALHVKLFFDEINRQFPQRLGRKRRFLPETEDGPTAQKLIAQTGLKPVEGRSGYETIWIDLQQSEDALRANLKQKWRNRLNVAERAGLQLDWNCDPQIIAMIAAIYAADRTQRGYGGISPKLFTAYAPLLAAKGELHLARAMKAGETVAFAVTVEHGRSATYLIGWTSDAGKNDSAATLLLWETMLRLKNKGIKEFDLGGINDDSAAGIKTFKEGLGGRIVRYVGHHA